MKKSIKDCKLCLDKFKLELLRDIDMLMMFEKGIQGGKTHNELPFFAERMKIRKVEKLVPNLKDKKTCAVHIKSLNQALKHCLKLKKVHWVIRFEQSHWMKPYIMLNTNQRTAVKNRSEKLFFKLINKIIFGITMENIGDHKDMKLVASREKYAKYVMMPHFKDGYLFSKE